MEHTSWNHTPLFQTIVFQTYTFLPSTVCLHILVKTTAQYISLFTSKNLWYGFLINLLSLLNLPKKVDKTLQKNKLKTTLTFKQLTFTFKNFKRCFKMKELWVEKDSFPQRVLRGNTLHHYSRALPMLLMRRWNPTPTVTNQP